MTVSFIPETGACYSKFTHGPSRDNDVYAWGARLVIEESDHESIVTKREEEKDSDSESDSEHGLDEDQEEVEAEAAPGNCYFYPPDVCRLEADGTIVEKRNSQSYWHLFPGLERTTSCTTTTQIDSSTPSARSPNVCDTITDATSSSSYVVLFESKIAGTPVSTRIHSLTVLVIVSTIESRPASSPIFANITKSKSRYIYGHPHAPHSTAQWVKYAESFLRKHPPPTRLPWFQTVNPGYSTAKLISLTEKSTARLQTRAESTPIPEVDNDVEYVSVIEYWPTRQLEDEKKYETVPTPTSSSSSLLSSDLASSTTPTFNSSSGLLPIRSRIPDQWRPNLPFSWEKPTPESSIKASSTSSSSKGFTSASSTQPFSFAEILPTLVSFTPTSLSEISTQASSTSASSTMGALTRSSSASSTLTHAPRPSGAPTSNPPHLIITVPESDTSTSVNIVVVTVGPITHTVFVPIPTPSFISVPASLSHTPSNPPEMIEFGDGPWDHEGGKGEIHQHRESSQNYENHINQGKKENSSDGEMSESWNQVDTKYNGKYKSETGYQGGRDRVTKVHWIFEED